jgi:hypothetical protein
MYVMVHPKYISVQSVIPVWLIVTKIVEIAEGRRLLKKAFFFKSYFRLFQYAWA